MSKLSAHQRRVAAGRCWCCGERPHSKKERLEVADGVKCRRCLEAEMARVLRNFGLLGPTITTNAERTA